MRAMILAAGRGARMRELTNKMPKPLLNVAGHYLIEYAIMSLKRAGIYEIVINTSYRGDQIKAALGDGKQYGVNIVYSEEPERLETGGGILQAMPLLGDERFLVMSSDIITDYPIEHIVPQRNGLAHLIMVSNPSFHPRGDFGLNQGKIDTCSTPTYTFANIGVYHPDLFKGCEPGHFRLTHVLKPAIQAGLVSGECYQGRWYNVGTPEDLTALNQRTNLPI